MAHQPSKYNRQFEFRVSGGIRCVLRWDKPQAVVTRFVVQLQRLSDPLGNEWKTFAQIDHEPGNPKGHDLYQEGVHVDIYHVDDTESILRPNPSNSGLPKPPVDLMYACKKYLCDHVEYFDQVARNEIGLTQPPRFL